MKKVLRVGKVFVDWSQNDDHKTTVCVYSLRAKERPTVSTPVSWEEVEHALAKKDAGMLVFEAAQVIERMEKSGDLFAPVLKLKQKLPDLGAIEGPAAEKLNEAKTLADGAGRPKSRRVAAGKSTRAGATSRKASARKRA